MTSTTPLADSIQALHTMLDSAWASRSDINEHLPTLYMLASRCQSVVEFGVRNANSTMALLAAIVGRPHTWMRSWDLNESYNGRTLARMFPLWYQCGRGNSLEVTPVDTDLLFIDTLHTYGQLKAELERHGSHARRYIVLHDTELFGWNGEAGERGINPAWTEWVEAHPEWKTLFHTPHNSGLTVLERR